MNFKELIIPETETLLGAMKGLDKSHKRVMFVVGEKGVLKASISDGDIRRHILAGGDLNDSIMKAANLSPFSERVGYDQKKLKEIFLESNFAAIPILEDSNELVDVVLWEDIFTTEKKIIHKGKIDAHVVIMAGGFGTRLQPFTNVLPKPLIPINDKTLLEHIVDKFLNYDVDEFYFTVNYKSKIIKSYFDEVERNYKIKYIKEDKPLGTIGALSLAKREFTKPVFVTNCDIIIDAAYNDFFDFHKSNGFDISLVASMMSYKIPYGICEIDQGGAMKTFKEKPETSFLASTGMYIINPEIVNLIPENEHFHVTDLMNKVRENGGSVGVYPISQESWMDTGDWDEYKKTVQKIGI